MSKRILYLCDGERCDVCYSDCHHTSDVKYALNGPISSSEKEFADRFYFYWESDTWWEKEGGMYEYS